MKKIGRNGLLNENSTTYVKLVCFFAIGCVFGIIASKALPYSMANFAISKILNFAQQSKIAICVGIFFKSITWPTFIFIITYLGFTKAVPLVFCTMGIVFACSSSLCTIAGGFGGYFASVICCAAINFVSLLCSLIIGAVALNTPCRRIRHALSEQACAVYITICIATLVFSIAASIISVPFINAAIYLIK